MKTFRILASYTAYCSLEIQAENIDEAREIAQETDGGEFHSDEYGDWNIDDIVELEKPYTCPKFEPAEEEKEDKMSKWIKQVNKDIREGLA